MKNIINFNETNFTDESGSFEVITRRACRHAERIIDHSKQSKNIIFVASGVGYLLASVLCTRQLVPLQYLMFTLHGKK